MERSRRNKGDKSATRPKKKDYVIVTVVEDMGKARDCKDLLEENDIPALVREQEGASGENRALRSSCRRRAWTRPTWSSSPRTRTMTSTTWAWTTEEEDEEEYEDRMTEDEE